MPELYGGTLRAFYGEALFTAAQIEAAASKTAPKIPMHDSGTPYDWAQIFTKGKSKFSVNRKSEALSTDQTGDVDIIGTEFSSMLDLPIADMSLANWMDLIQVGMGDSPVAADKVIRGHSTNGLNFTDFARPILLYRKSFDPVNNSAVPKIGTGADPKGLLIFAANPPEQFDIFGGDSQEIIQGSFKVTAVDGSTVLGLNYLVIDLASTVKET